MRLLNQSHFAGERDHGRGGDDLSTPVDQLARRSVDARFIAANGVMHADQPSRIQVPDPGAQIRVVMATVA
jgi:hypothetical protein